MTDDAELYRHGGEALVLFSGTLYRAGEPLKRENAGRKAATHSGLIYRDGGVYKAKRDHGGYRKSEATAYKPTTPDSFVGTLPPVKSHYSGILTFTNARLLTEIEPTSKEAKATCEVCGISKRYKRHGESFVETLEDHIQNRHLEDGGITAEAMEAMYDVQS